MKICVMILALAGLMNAQYVIGDRRYEGIQNMAPAAAWIPPLVATDPSGACLRENAVVMSVVTGALFRCSSGTWAGITSGPGGGQTATMFSALGDLKGEVTSGTVITVGSACSVPSPCNLSTSTTNVTVTSPITFTRTGGNAGGVCLIYATAAGTVVMDCPTGTGITSIASSGGTGNVNITTPEVPLNAWHIANVTVTAGAFTAVIDKRAPNGRPAQQPGTGLVLDPSGNVLSVNPAVVATWADLGSMDTQGRGFALASPFDGAATSNAGFNNNVAAPYYTQFFLPTAITLRRFRIFSTSVTASGGVALAIYDSSCTKVAGAEAAAVVSTVADQTLTLATPVSLLPGVYHLGLATGGNITFYQIAPGHPDKINLLNESGFPRVFTGSAAATGTGAGLTLPTACGTKTAVATFPTMSYLLP